MKKITCYFANVFFFIFAASIFAQPATTTPDFIIDASIRSLAIIKAADLALEKSSSQEVKAYAQRIKSEYTAINDALINLAQQRKIKLPDTKTRKETAENLTLEVTERSAFDVAYGQNQVPAIQQLITLFHNAAASENYDVRNFATSNLPKLRRHLLLAEQLYAATKETRTDIYQQRDDQLDSAEDESNTRIPTTDQVYPQR